MFKNISINLEGPICSCEFQNLGWSIVAGPSLNIRCLTCKISILIPRESFYATFILDKEYPDDETDIAEQNISPKDLPKNVIDFTEFKKKNPKRFR